MIQRVFDATEINRIINHPDVYPYVAYRIPQGELDLGPLLADPNNVLMMGEGGGVFFHRFLPCLYQAHIQFLPEHRGRAALRASREAVTYMFSFTDCKAIIGVTPVNNKPAIRFAQFVGFQYGPIIPKSCPTQAGMVDGLQGRLTKERYLEKYHGH